MPHKRRSSVGFALSPTKRSSILTTPHSETPLAKRQSLADMSLTSDNVFLDVPENNDEQEKKERQLNRLQQQRQSRNFSSPTVKPADSRKSVNAVAGLTNQQLTEHYSKCIQLSTENKISVKNAFNLQLIDYMSEMLQRKDSDMNNFQVASCTLDASAKIYAYRVDSIHTDTLKIAGGLGRTQGKEKNKENGEDDHIEGATVGDKKRRKVKRKVIETNLKNINITNFDLEFDVDPLFKKTASQFDDGCSGSGIFLNCLQLQDDSCALMLDAETVINNFREETTPAKTEKVLVPKPEDLTKKLICPTFAPFEFTSWKLGDEDSFCDTSKVMGDMDDNHRFDVNAIPAPIDENDDFIDDVKAMNSDKADANKRKKKEFISLLYDKEDEDPDIAKAFAVTRKATKLSQITLKIWSKEKSTLPVDLHYKARNFTKLFGRPLIVIQRQKKAAAVDDSIHEYDYDNQNDRDNYCTDVDDGENLGGGYDITENFSQTIIGSQPLTGEEATKKVDMKKLKGTMWSLLSDPTTNKENENQNENQAEMDPNQIVSFSLLYKKLTPRLSSKMQENISIPLAFSALLHLANEHNLELYGSGSLEDFSVKQG
ncbi:Condensin complex subunit 2-like [Homarus americanus]|uniref:Condensin complex subunit 2 n=1 Tax=Homarus americanus TaxID=6706 RepID=A0A8J5N4H7_HOMAM|nr:Condensin complex subunit 2-like [Homarus americanus]